MYQRILSILVFWIVAVPVPAHAVDPDFSRLTIRSFDDAQRQRGYLTQLIFGNSYLPSVSPQVTGNQLVYPLPNGYASTATLHVPDRPNNQLVIYHHGHFNDADIARIDQEVLSHFLPAGYTVLLVNMPLYGPNRDTRYTTHDAFYPNTTNAMRYFVEPLVAFVNHLAPRHARIAMVGLSGGGWTTVLYSALDSRIAKSYPVAGSYPDYITREVPMSRDIEQFDPAIYSNIDYLDFYAIAGMRHQHQIYNFYDPCCFFGDYGKQYEPAVASVVRPFGGNFSVFVDYDNRDHSISEAAYTLILNDLSRAPFLGVPHSIPGTIQAEDFDNGGEGVAYHDTDINNNGGAYRSTAVDIQASGGAESGGYDIGWTQAGEWLEYTVNVATADSHTVEARVASDGDGGTFHIEFNGVDRTGPITVPNTGGWQNWTTLTIPNVNLGAGTQVMRLAQDSNGPVTNSIGNINWIRFTGSSQSVTYISDLAYTAITNGYGPVEKDRSNGENGANDGRTIRLNGVAYAKGLGVHAVSEVRVPLNGNYTRFISDIGIDDEMDGTPGTAQFEVWADGVRLYQSPDMNTSSPTLTIDVDVTGRQELVLKVLEGSAGCCDHADWAAARLIIGSSPPPDTRYISDLAYTVIANGYGPVERDASNGENSANDGRTITLNGVTYTKGLGVHAVSEVRVPLNGQYTRFISDIGVDDEMDGTPGTAQFEVWADGVRLYQSPDINTSSQTITVDVDVTGRQELRLLVLEGSVGCCDHADWAGARLILGSAPPPSDTYVSDLPYIAVSNGWGPVERDMSNGENQANDGRAISLNGVTYTKGLGVHAVSEVRVPLNGNYTRFISDIGIDDEMDGTPGTAQFEVWADGLRLYQSPDMTASSTTIPINVDVTGYQELVLRVLEGSVGCCDHADWAGARLVR